MNLKELEASAHLCRECPLRSGATQVVFGEGVTTKPTVMIVGEGPGQTEDETGRPFVGPAGVLLREKLDAGWIKEDEIYYTNIVKCRPPGNREPKPEEVKACHRWLAWQVKLIDPQVIVTVGNPATRAVLGDNMPGITKINGQLHSTAGGRNVVTLIHPAAPLHNPELMPAFEQGIKDLGVHLYNLSDCPF